MIDAHRGAFEHDWRARFHMPLASIGGSMSWGEALRLAQGLATDPSSMLGSSLAGWEHPVSREALVLMDLFDLQHISKSKRRPPPYPRPWRTGKTVTRHGTKQVLTQDEIIAVLQRAGHTAPVPVRDNQT